MKFLFVFPAFAFAVVFGIMNVSDAQDLPWHCCKTDADCPQYCRCVAGCCVYPKGEFFKPGGDQCKACPAGKCK